MMICWNENINIRHQLKTFGQMILWNMKPPVWTCCAPWSDWCNILSFPPQLGTFRQSARNPGLEKKWISCILIKISITTPLRCPLRDISQYLEIGRTSPPPKAKHHIILKLDRSAMKHIFISYIHQDLI